MAETRIWTYEDAVEHLKDSYNAKEQTRLARIMYRAVLAAYRDLPNKTRWTYYDRQKILNTVAQQTTGTLAYDHTGGTHERQVTLTDATVPDDVHLYRLIIGSTHYDVKAEKSSTVFTLTTNSNPGEDVAAGTSYTLYRGVYPLPVDFRKLNQVFDVENEHEIRIISSDAQHALAVHWYDSPDTPWVAAVRNAGEHLGRLSLIFGPPPSTARQYDISYEAAPRQLNIRKYATGTVTTNGTTTVTGTGTAFADAHVGSVIRFSGSATAPTAIDGDNPFTHQRIVQEVTDGTTLVVDADVPALTDVAFTISDPLDLEEGAMFTAFQRLLEAEYERLARLKTRREAWEMSQRAIVEALEADRRTINAESHNPQYDRFARVTVTDDD